MKASATSTKNQLSRLDGSNPCTRRLPTALLFHEHTNYFIGSVVVNAAAKPANGSGIQQHRDIRGKVTHVDVVRMDFLDLARGILDMIDLLFLVNNLPAGMNLDEVLGEQPLHGSWVAVVRGVQPDVIHHRDG